MHIRNATRYGHCAICDCEIMRMEPGGRCVKLPIYAIVSFKLLNQSRMDVAVCTHCRHDTRWTESLFSELWEKGLLRGWQIEADQLVRLGQWSVEQSERYMLSMALDGIESRIA